MRSIGIAVNLLFKPPSCNKITLTKPNCDMNYASIPAFSANVSTKKSNKNFIIKPPCEAIDFHTKDIYGTDINLDHYNGKGILLCFFRNTNRPLRNYRLLELTRKHKEWKKIGVEIIVVFNESSSILRSYFKAKPRPFPVIPDPKLYLYQKYGVQRILGKGIIAPTQPSPTWIKKIFRGPLEKLKPTGRIMPADFLINTEGKIIGTWYGKNETDHMPNERLETFAIATRIAIRKRELQ